MADLHVHTLTVRNHRITCDSPVLVQHGMGHDAIALDLDAEWDGLSARLVLGPCGSAYDVLYEGEPVVVPAATLAEAGWLPVSVVGHGEDGTVRVTTERCDHLLRVVESGCTDGSVPPEDQPDLLGQLVEAAERADASADSADRATAEATGAASAATEAAGKVDAAVESAAQATEAAKDAATAATDAAKSATDAAERADKLAEDIPAYVTASQQAATEAARAASEADGAATAAGKSASAAAGSAEQAYGSATAAQGSADAASGSAQQAATSAVEAEGSATAASESATEAKSSASAAAQSATDAKASADLAAGWVPAGGEPGQILTKTEDGTAWRDAPSGNVLTGTATGYVAHAEDAYAQKPIEVRVKGRTVKNLWPVIASVQDGLTIATDETGLITVSGTATASGHIRVKVSGLAENKNVSAVKSGGTIAVSLQAWKAGAYVRDVMTVNTSESTANTGTGFDVIYARINYTSGETYNASFRVMLVEGAAAPDCFTPPASITSVQAGNLVTAGKNLSKVTEATIASEIGSSDFVDISDELPPGTYTVKGVDATGEVDVCARSVDGSAETIWYGPMNQGQAVKIPGGYYLQIYHNPNDGVPYSVDVSSIQLELGSTPTAYEPPDITQTPLPEVELRGLPNGTCDELVIAQDGTATVERQTYHELFDGGTGIATNSYTPIEADGYQYVALNSTKDKPAGANISMFAVISDRFATGNKAPGNVVVTTGSVSGDGRNYIALLFCFEPGTFADADEVRQWFTDNPTNVWFAGMPEIEPQSPVTLPVLPAPTFNVYHDSQVPSDTSVEYERDINIALERLEAKIAALNVAQATS